MVKLDVTALDKEIKRGKVYPIYAVLGEETHLSDAAIRIIKKAVIKDGQEEMSVRKFTSKEASAGEILDALNTVSFFSSSTFVIISDFSKPKKSFVDALSVYAKNPSTSATLMIVAKKADGRTSLMQTISKNGCIVECKPLYADKVPFWINMEVKRRGKNISLESAKFLSDMIGNDLAQISQAIERLVLFIGKRESIDLSDIEQAIAETHQRTIFELTDAVGQRKLAKAVSLLHNILENGGIPVITLSMLARHFRILSKAKEVAGRLSSKGDMAKYLGVHPYYADNYIGQSKNFSKNELRRSFRILHRCDRSIKSSRLPREIILERAIIALVEKNDG